MIISIEQFNYLQGFYTHCYAAYHQDGDLDGGFWAKQLDSLNVPWSVQNTVSSLAEDRQSMSYYLRNLLKKSGIQVEGGQGVAE